MAVTVAPFQHSSGFGAEISDIDLNDMDQSTFEALERALYTHKLLLVRGQKDLLPSKQLELVMRFDPLAKPVHGHGTAKDVMKGFKGKKSLVGANPAVPDEPMVRLIGKTTVPVGHHGVTEPTVLRGASHTSFHKDVLTQEQLDAGETRFMRWHIDAALYRVHPPKVTSLWAHTLPEGPLLNARWDDGSDLTMKVPAGRTAFIDSTKMYEALSEEDKAWVKYSRVEYPPSPYQWIQDVKATNNGFGMVSEGKEIPFDGLPSNDPAGIITYPLLWTNPFTGEKALQVHQIVASKLFIKTSEDGLERVVDDVAEVRKILDDLQRPFLVPENILVPPQQEGDMALWWNRGLRHTAIEYPSQGYGERLCHQVHVAGSDNPGSPDVVQKEYVAASL